MGEPLELPPPIPPSYRDRSTGLVLFGLLQLLFAVLALGCATLMGVMLVSPALRQVQGQVYGQTPTGTMIVSILVYPLAAAFFGILGVGTLLGRRWARAIWLVVSWLWLAVGVVSTLVLVFFLPKILGMTLEKAGAGQETQGAMTCAMVAVVAFAGCFYILLPLAFLFFFRSPHVRATVEAKDPKERWTDRCPLPVLGAVLVSGYSAIACLLGLGYGLIPIAGHLVRGFPAILIFLVLAAVNAVLAVGLYRLRPAAWKGAIALYGAFALLFATNFARGIPWREMYGAMGTPAEQIELMEKSGLLEAMQGPAFLIPTALLMAAALGYLWWLRRYFREP
jgi:hypothetical protein